MRWTSPFGCGKGEGDKAGRNPAAGHAAKSGSVVCRTEIPEFLDVDVSALKIGDSLHVRDLAPPRSSTS